jgi:hypothetical protein
MADLKVEVEHLHREIKSAARARLIKGQVTEAAKRQWLRALCVFLFLVRDWNETAPQIRKSGYRTGGAVAIMRSLNRICK